MGKGTIVEKVIQIVTEEIGSVIKVTSDTVVLNATGLDEHTGRELVMRVEEEYNITIPETDAEKLHTVKDIVDYVTEATKESGKE